MRWLRRRRGGGTPNCLIVSYDSLFGFVFVRVLEEIPGQALLQARTV